MGEDPKIPTPGGRPPLLGAAGPGGVGVGAHPPPARRVVVLDKVTDFLLFLGKLLIVGGVGAWGPSRMGFGALGASKAFPDTIGWGGGSPDPIGWEEPSQIPLVGEGTSWTPLIEEGALQIPWVGKSPPRPHF